jgi:hypothetical protein
MLKNPFRNLPLLAQRLKQMKEMHLEELMDLVIAYRALLVSGITGEIYSSLVAPVRACRLLERRQRVSMFYDVFAAGIFN